VSDFSRVTDWACEGLRRDVRKSTGIKRRKAEVKMLEKVLKSCTHKSRTLIFNPYLVRKLA
jgi:hypothetical protein